VVNGGPPLDALALVAGFAVAVLLGTNIQTRLAYLHESEERARTLERERIAREMHDILAHNLAVIVALADGATATTPADPERGIDLMRKASTTARQALTDIRRLIGALRLSEADDRPPAPQPGLEDLEELVGQVRAAGLDLTLTRTGTPGCWGPGAELAIYRIIQEALTNTVKHAGPHAKAEVRLHCAETSADVEIVDNGGDRPAATSPSAGHGLTGMTERAAPYRGPSGSRTRPRLRLASTHVPDLQRKSARMSIRVLLVDDQSLVRLGFRAMLDQQPDLDVVGEAGDGAHAINKTRALRPDVVLMDVRMPTMDGIEATRRVVESGSAARILVLTTFDLDEYVSPRCAPARAGSC